MTERLTDEEFREKGDEILSLLAGVFEQDATELLCAVLSFIATTYFVSEETVIDTLKSKYSKYAKHEPSGNA